MNFNPHTSGLFTKLQYYFSQLQYFSILLLVLLLPYWGAWKLMKLLIIIIFVSSLFAGSLRIKALLTNKVILALFAFILFTYISSLWSPSDTVFTDEYRATLNRYKYFFLVIPGIYFSSLSTKKIKNIFFIMALAPIGTAIVYYLNAFGITAIYSPEFGGNSKIFVHYLANNFFLTYAALYFLHLSLNTFIKKEYKQFIVFFLLLILFASSMVIDPHMSSRLTLLVFILVAVITPLFYLKRKHAVILFALSVLVVTVFMSTNTKMQQGLDTFKTAIEENRYTGSWGHRLGFVIVGLNIFKEHPVVGRGVSDVRARVVTYAEENPQYFLQDPARHFHNEHLQILVEVGVVGYLLYLLFLFLFLRIPISDLLINNIKYTYTISFLLMQFGEHYLMFYATSIFIAIFFILVILYGEREKEELAQTVDITKPIS